MGDSGSSLSIERKYGIALALYAVLAVLAWFTIGEGTVAAFGRQIEIRWVPVFILGTFAFRTYIAMQAERIRRGR
jgi:uncharacterized RDD family membrane protein YckC